jgi:hypothetical protein
LLELPCLACVARNLASLSLFFLMMQQTSHKVRNQARREKKGRQ